MSDSAAAATESVPPSAVGSPLKEKPRELEPLIEKPKEDVDEPRKVVHVPDGRWTGPLVFAVLAAAFGSSFQFGYHIGNINLPAALIKEWFNHSSKTIHGQVMTAAENESIWSIAVGIFAFGGMFGGVSVGTVADKLGRKRALLFNNALAIIAGALMTGAKYVDNYWLFVVGRFIIGLNSGLNSGLAPMYLTEISPANLRGAIGSFAQLFVTISILFSQILGLPFLLGTPGRWPLIFAFTFVPVVVQLGTLSFCPESPKYNLVVRGQKEQAEADLKKLRQQSDVGAELEQINEEAVAARAQAKVTMLDMFGARLRWPLTLAVFMMVSQQLSGINAAMFYSTDIFKAAGLQDQWPNYATIGMGAINVFMTIVSVYLVDNPRFGRRTLHIAGMVGMCFSTAMIAISMILAKSNKSFSFMSIAFVLFFVISFATGPGSIPWFYVNEVFPSNARGNANSIAVLTNWLCVVLVAIFFPIINRLMAEYCFFVFTALLAVFILFALKFLPETKNKTLEEVQAEMDRRRGVRGGAKKVDA